MIMTSKARVLVTIKQDVLDPQGEAVKKKLERLGLGDSVDVRIGKVIDISFNSEKDLDANRDRIQKMALEVLSNPIIEDFVIEDQGE